MDTAEYDTNTLLINNIASIAFRVYESPSDLPQSFASVALDIENTLREEGHVVFYDAARRGIWHFRIIGKQGHDDVTSHGIDATLELCGQTLVVGEEGALEPASLQRTRPQQQQQQGIQTPTSSISSASALDQSQRNAFASASQGAVPSSQDHDAKTADASGVDSKAGATPNKTVYENFVTAVLLSISSTFCNRSGAVPLNFRTVLLPPEPLESGDPRDADAEQCPVLATLKAYLTTTGALVISFGVSRCKGLTSVVDLVATSPALPGTPILAAPFGVVALNQFSSAVEAGTPSLAQTPNTQALSLRGGPDVHDSLWKQACLKILKLRGVASTSLSDCSWVSLLVSKPKLQGAYNETRRVQALGSGISIPWPGPLCFRKRAVEVSSTSRVGDTLLSGHEESHDPLGRARAWFNTATERDEKVLKRKAERAAASKDASSAESRVPKPSAPSPVAIRRPSTAAASAIYPTPPDGIQHPNGVTPSFDGTLSSPGNPLSVAPATETDPAAPSTIAMGDTFDVEGDFSESKRQRSESNLLGEAEHVFGVMGEDMFGDNDITEADFNFFDEQQPGDSDADMSMDDAGAANNASDEAPKADEESLRVANEAKPEPVPQRDAMVFAKPELKHARSSRNDAVGQRGRDTPSGATKRESSPFDPHTVFKRVRASLVATERGSSIPLPDSTRMTRIFESMSFDSTLPMINKKYEQGGQFDYKKIARTEKPRLEPGMLPETDYLKRHGRQGRRLKDRRLHAGSLVRTLTGIVPPTLHPSPTKVEGSLSDDDDSSVGSDQDDSSYTTEEPTSPLKSSVKLVALDDDATSQITSLREVEPLEEPNQHLAMELPRLSKPEIPELPLALLFSDPEPLSLDLSLSDDDLVQVAQILTEQAALGSLDICNAQEGISPHPDTNLSCQSLSVDARNAIRILRDFVPSLLRGAGGINLKGFLDIPDIPLLGQPSRLQPRPIPGRDPNVEPLRPSNLYQISGPHLEVRRYEVKLSVLPSAVPFWESLGLAPSPGGKDINAICVFPGWNGMVDNVKTFLGRVKSVYEMLKLGSLESMPSSADMDDGILPYEVDRISTSPDATMTGHGSALIEIMETLRGAISNLTVTETNVVVYFVYSPNNPGTMVEACIAFQRFFDSYRKALASQREAAPNELVLQLVSADMLSSATTVVVTPVPELIKLCMETYDRCTLFGGPMPAPAIRLEQPLPRIIDFKLTMSPSASLIRENSCIHVAYAPSVDGRWVTAAWTDDRGSQQETASYCLGRKGRPQSRTMNEVAHEIWESTLDLISVWKVHWRIIITKCGPMDQQEVDFWVDLARTEIKASVTMILMTVDTNPSLQLIPPVVKLPQPSTALYTTPVSTPQASIVSPEQSGTPATPARDANAAAATPGADGAGETDSDAVLSDITDQTWGAVVGHRLNNSSSVLEVHPALVSGYLIKRTGTKIEDAPVLMEVNLVHTDASPRAYEPLLREMLSYFRGLGTLARARGVVQRETDVRPWHVAAAEKAVRAMYLLM
ncbi:Mediator of RNA polymerase II transcription subunit 13 [Tolypocladium ophioglossoides CBS 100239]|uniref:Mediator of RNA polymerase II transcription subunit 13 n=1 Tax=Tolypocladium ophioglossoides (strain CBS 100239) TaxID=1163406 RepID=A0A0L0N957_TOLOC|nr:Mediator of RNA polymerase II transcription subunit 13 [Tolypocladium ophioglossoides CBS 100239]